MPPPGAWPPPPGWQPRRPWERWELPLGIALGGIMGIFPLLGFILPFPLGSFSVGGSLLLVVLYIGLVLGLAGAARRFGVMVGFAIGVPVAFLVFFVTCFAVIMTL